MMSRVEVSADLHDGHERGSLSVHHDDIGLRRIAVADVRDIPNVDRIRAHRLDRQIIHFLNGLGARIQVHVVFRGADFYSARGQNQVLISDRGDHVVGRKSLGLERGDIQVHLDLALLASVRVREDGALHGRQLRAQEIRRQVVQLLLGKALSGKCELKNRDGGRVVGQDERRNRSRGILPDGGLRDGRDLRHRHINAHVGIEKNLDDAEPVQGLRFDVLDVVDRRGQSALEADDKPLGNVLGGKPRISINDR